MLLLFIQLFSTANFILNALTLSSESDTFPRTEVMLKYLYAFVSAVILIGNDTCEAFTYMAETLDGIVIFTPVILTIAGLGLSHQTEAFETTFVAFIIERFSKTVIETVVSGLSEPPPAHSVVSNVQFAVHDNMPLENPTSAQVLLAIAPSHCSVPSVTLFPHTGTITVPAVSVSAAVFDIPPPTAVTFIV
jgi:hypothetical protein